MNNLICFPPNFIGVKFYPGYYLNLENNTVYSIKSGILKPLKYKKPSKFTRWRGGYSTSINGHRKMLTDDYLYKVKQYARPITIIKQQ